MGTFLRLLNIHFSLGSKAGQSQAQPPSMATLLSEPGAACLLQCRMACLCLHTFQVKLLPGAEPSASPWSEGSGSLESLCSLDSLKEICTLSLLCPSGSLPLSFFILSLFLYSTLSSQKACSALRALLLWQGSVCTQLFLLSILLSLASFLAGVAVVHVLGIPSNTDISHSRATLEIIKRFMTLHTGASSLIFVVC